MHPVEPRERPYRFRNCSHWAQWGEFFPRNASGPYCPACRAIRRNETYRTEPELPAQGDWSIPDNTDERLARWRDYLERQS